MTSTSAMGDPDSDVRYGLDSHVSVVWRAGNFPIGWGCVGVGMPSLA